MARRKGEKNFVFEETCRKKMASRRCNKNHQFSVDQVANNCRNWFGLKTQIMDTQQMANLRYKNYSNDFQILERLCI